ncbi:probable serine/threonine-protein kinase PBL21 [Papaver somniferum]|uniref:probable serine/threonine-protein kinase PBL21 n=1 Tax=Papaver somniferum TaxID=3469 RepID=UPI000E6FEC4E|nr:probable serine/threonine-protein kinase PBL21 [Papaver somniferum]
MAFGCFGSSSKSVIQPGLVANNEDEGVVEATEDDDIPMFDLAQLAAATDDFDESKILGSGGFGIVYKGTLNGQEVAIKRHSTHKKHRQAFWDEVNMLKLNRLRNPNVVRLIGYHATDDNLMMVLELMPLGSLDKHIYGVQEQPLNWSKG